MDMLRTLSHHLLPYVFSSLGLLGIHLGGPWMSLGILVLFVLHPALDHLLTKLFGEIEKLEHTPAIYLFMYILFIKHLSYLGDWKNLHGALDY